MKNIHIGSIAISAALLASSASAAVIITDFESPDVSATTNFLSGYTANGFDFDYGGSPFIGLRIIEDDRPDLYNGTQTIGTRFSSSAMVIEREDGGLFTPISSDFDGTDSSSPALLIEGFYESGGSFSQSFFGDSVLGNENLSYDNTTTIAAGVGFNDIVRLEITSLNGSTFQRDNFVADVAAIPEPSSAVLLGLGALFAIGYRRRRR